MIPDDNEPNGASVCMQATAEPTRLSVPSYVVRTALGAAENAVSELNDRIADAQMERDGLARRIGLQQKRLDALMSEQDLRTRHVRQLQAALAA